MVLLLQVAIWSAVLAYLWQRHAYLRRRNRRSWTELADQLNSVLTIDGNLSPWTAGRAASGKEGQTLDWRGAWRHLNEARLILEMADYAERNSTPMPAWIDPILLVSVRSSAMQMRIAMLIVLVKCLFLP